MITAAGCGMPPSGSLSDASRSTARSLARRHPRRRAASATGSGTGTGRSGRRASCSRPAPSATTSAGHRHRAVRAAVERALERDDLAAAGRRLAELQRGVDGVRAGGPAELDLRLVAHRLRAGATSWSVGELVLELGREVEAVSRASAAAARRPRRPRDGCGRARARRRRSGSR